MIQSGSSVHSQAAVGAAVGAEATHVPPPQMQHALLAGSTPLTSTSVP